MTESFDSKEFLKLGISFGSCEISILFNSPPESEAFTSLSTYSLADKIILLNNGEVEKIGESKELMGNILSKANCCRLGGEA